jgi:hypothetical protein
MLSDGAIPQSEIAAAFERIDVCGWRTVEEAKKALGTTSYRGTNNVSYWKYGE